MPDSTTSLAVAFMGLVGGIVLVARGLLAYRRDRLISAVATSSLDGLAAGEVRISGVVEALDQSLISPLQSRPCVWYRARIESTDDARRVLFAEERAVHFGLSDGRGRIRVIPTGARWEVSTAFDESTGPGGDEPPGLDRRRGAGYVAVVPDDPVEMSDLQRLAAIDALLTIDPSPLHEPAGPDQAGGLGLLGPGFLGPGLTGSGRRYREARLEVGQTVTVLGQALPWADVREDLSASLGDNVEHSIADDLSEARAAGRLAGTPEEAWGNAAIPGFGIGHPTRTPQLDPAARRPEVAGPAAHEAAMRRYEIPGHELVLARTPGGELAVYPGAAGAAMQRHDGAVLLGLAGAVMTVVCTLALGVTLAARPWP